MLEKHRAALAICGDPFGPLCAARGKSDGETFDVLDADWSGESLVCKIAYGPDYSALATLTNLTVTSEERTWQQLKDDCYDVESLWECGTALTDLVWVSYLTVNWSEDDLSDLPRAETLGEPVELYYEVVRADGSGQRFVAGQFILTESIL